MEHADIGQIVKAHYKSGTYAGEIIEERGENYLIKVLAVIKHPLQGDIHNYGQTENVFFHQRKALSYQEKMNVSKPAVHPFDEEVPDYLKSLKNAVKVLEDKLSKNQTAFNEKALANLQELKNQYF